MGRIDLAIFIRLFRTLVAKRGGKVECLESFLAGIFACFTNFGFENKIKRYQIFLLHFTNNLPYFS
jgi:hypothetical protein